jgi:hypothetical protein
MRFLFCVSPSYLMLHALLGDYARRLFWRVKFRTEISTCKFCYGTAWIDMNNELCTFCVRKTQMWTHKTQEAYVTPEFRFEWVYITESRDSAVGIATGYGLDDRGVGVRVPVGSRIFSSPRRPDRLWSPPSLQSTGYQGLFPWGKAAGAWSWPLTSN